MSSVVPTVGQGWDFDQFRDLQERAWECESLANVQVRSPESESRQAGIENRSHASDLRREAARLLSRFWDVGIAGRNESTWTHDSVGILDRRPTSLRGSNE
jgi:hypothetical protein